MRSNKLTVIGMGYVGMPIAIEFAKYMEVNGFDIDEQKIRQYQMGKDPTNEVGEKIIKESTVNFTSNRDCIKGSEYIIVAVPTPINQDKTPDLTPVISASRLIGENLSNDTYVVFESTVYPGVTEDICIPILEEYSGLEAGKDFYVGYSPERINPGDKVHKLSNIKKIIAGQDEFSTNKLANLYEKVVLAGVVKVSNIKTAEATKVIENSQRDINIAFMNEVAMIFNEMKIDTNEVVAAMNTKWNALGFTPGLVGGHCIGVDPYYFIYEAEKLGYHSELITTGRRINDGMAKFIAENTVKELIKGNKKVKNSQLLILGLTFKENTPDTRNSKIFDVIEILNTYGIKIDVYDPVVDQTSISNTKGYSMINEIHLNKYDCILLGVKHDIFKNISINELEKYFIKNRSDEENLLIDIKGLLDCKEVNEFGINYWSL